MPREGPFGGPAASSRPPRAAAGRNGGTERRECGGREDSAAPVREAPRPLCK